MSIRHPDWAPPILVHLLGDPGTPDGDRKLLERLAGDPRMESVWNEVRRRSRRLLARTATPDQVALDLWFAVKAAMAGADFEAAMRAERLSVYPAIASQARQLAETLHGTLLDVLVIPDEVVYGQRAEPAPREPTLLPTNKAPDRLEPRWHTSASAFLYALADEADRLEADFKGEVKLLPRPNTPEGRRLGFLRVLAAHLTRECGSPLYRTLATLASASLSEPLDLEQVRAAVRNWLTALNE